MQRDTKKLLNREKLLDRGVALLMAQGYHGTGLQEILDAVEIPKGSFYNYFGSKEQFAAAVIVHYIEPFIQRLQEQLRHYPDDALLALRRYYDLLITELEKQRFLGGCLLGNLIGEISDTSALCRETLQNTLARYRDGIESALTSAQQQGSVRRDKTAREMADLLVNAWQGALLRMKVEQSTAPLYQFRDELLLGYCRANTP